MALGYVLRGPLKGLFFTVITILPKISNLFGITKCVLSICCNHLFQSALKLEISKAFLLLRDLLLSFIHIVVLFMVSI